MAKYDITHTCGHVEHVNLVGPYVQRDATIEKGTARDCLECFKTKQLEMNTKFASEHNLLPLTGSEKQVAWAMQIRKEMYHALTQDLSRYAGVDIYMEGKTNKKLENLFKVTEAKYFIDHRDY